MTDRHRVADHWTVLTIPRCQRQYENNECRTAVASKVPSRYAYQCTVCHREYRADRAWEYADEKWIADAE